MRKFALLLLLSSFVSAFALIPTQVRAQDDTYEEISYDDAEDEPGPVVVDPKLPSIAKFVLNGAEVKPSSTLSLTKDQVMNIQVTQLRPNTYVTVTVSKGGVKVGSESFKANQDGELELEITVPNKKLKGKAVITYTAASGKPVSFETEVNVE